MFYRFNNFENMLFCVSMCTSALEKMYIKDGI